MVCGCCTRSIKEKYALHEPVVEPKEERRPARVHKFKFGGPTPRGDAFPLFEKSRAGFLVIRGCCWLIYNDTLSREVHITMQFPSSVHPVAAERTHLTREASGWTATIVVYPLETVPFLLFNVKKGVWYNGIQAYASPLSSTHIQTVNAEAVKQLKCETQEMMHLSSRGGTNEEILYRCRRQKLMFVDLEFAPVSTSLQRSYDKKKIVNADNITWRRTIDYIPHKRRKEVQLFRNGIDPEDIDQGQLGDCWLMSSLSVLAAHPSFVKSIFRHPIASSIKKKEQKSGAYRVTLNKNGWWENVIVDSYLPTVAGQAVFGKCSQDPCALWVSLIEKAYAKLHGSYAAIVGGDELHALMDLTGFPIFSFDDRWASAKKRDAAAAELFKSLASYKKKGNMITISTPGKETSKYTGNQNNVEMDSDALQMRYKRLGLGLGHAYSVLDVRQFHLPNIKLVKIRNPWGAHSIRWTGAWSDSSEKWKKYPLVRLSCKPSKEDDGTFWMEWDDVLSFFTSGGVCMVKKNWFDYRMRGVFLGHRPVFVLEVAVKKKTDAFLLLSQCDKRGLPPDDPDAEYKSILISVSHYSAEKQKCVLHANSTIDVEAPKDDKFTFVTARNVSMRLTFTPEHSPYYVIPRIKDNPAETLKNFTLGLLSSRSVGTRGVKVNFKKLPADHAAFRNMLEYKMDDAQPQRLQFQCKPPGRFPVLREGESIHE